MRLCTYVKNQIALICLIWCRSDQYFRKSQAVKQSGPVFEPPWQSYNHMFIGILSDFCVQD